MNPPKCSDDDYINFVIASPRSVSATEAAKVQGDEEQAPAHDAFTRLLHRLEPDAATLWREAQTQVSLRQGILMSLLPFEPPERKLGHASDGAAFPVSVLATDTVPR